MMMYYINLFTISTFFKLLGDIHRLQVPTKQTDHLLPPLYPFLQQQCHHQYDLVAGLEKSDFLNALHLANSLQWLIPSTGLSVGALTRYHCSCCCQMILRNSPVGHSHDENQPPLARIVDQQACNWPEESSSFRSWPTKRKSRCCMWNLACRRGSWACMSWLWMLRLRGLEAHSRWWSAKCVENERY